MNKRQRANAFEDASQVARKVIVSAVIVGVFLIYSLLHNRTAGTTPATTGGSGSTNTGSTNTGSTTPASGGSYRDGSYTGSVDDAQWGYVQVKAIVQDGRLSDVQFLQYPNERARSQEINSYAVPQLTSEAVQAQSAQVDIVSGATDTSEAFMQSLSDALSSAQG